MRRRQRALLIALIILLALLACGLIAFYVWIAQPAKSSAPAEVPGLTHETSIYPPVSAKSLTFKLPARIAMAPNGELVFSDPSLRAVLRVSQTGRMLGSLQPKTHLLSPAGVGVWPDGVTWVADWSQAQIVVFDASGKEVRRIDQMTPLSINIVAGRAYVTGQGSVHVYSKAGNLLATFGRGRGAGTGQLDMPHGAIPAGNDVIVADSENSRVLRLRADNTVVWSDGARKKGMTNAAEGPFSIPTDLVIGERGFIFVIDAFNSQVSILDPKTGKVLRQVGAVGTKDGQFTYPEGLAYLGGDRYAVADKYNNRIQIVRIPLPGATAGNPLTDAISKIGPGDIGVLLIWCAVPLGLLLLATLVFLALRRRGHADERPSGGNSVMDVTTGDEES